MSHDETDPPAAELPSPPAPQAVNDRFGETYAAGAVLFREGEPGKHMYVIQSGRVQLTRKVRGKDTHLAMLPPGEFFGEMALINKAPRTATATAVEEARLLVLDARTFEAMIRGNAEIALRMMKKLATRLGQANSQVETLLRQDVNHRLVHQLRALAEVRGQADGPGVRIDISIDELGRLMGADVHEVQDGLERLIEARLVDKQVGSIWLAEVGRLGEFLEFLEIKERFG